MKLPWTIGEIVKINQLMPLSAGRGRPLEDRLSSRAILWGKSPAAIALEQCRNCTEEVRGLGAEAGTTVPQGAVRATQPAPSAQRLPEKQPGQALGHFLAIKPGHAS